MSVDQRESKNFEKKGRSETPTLFSSLSLSLFVSFSMNPNKTRSVALGDFHVAVCEVDLPMVFVCVLRAKGLRLLSVLKKALLRLLSLFSLLLSLFALVFFFFSEEESYFLFFLPLAANGGGGRGSLVVPNLDINISINLC